MSFDIIVIKPRRILSSLTECTADDVTDPLGSPAEIRRQCLKAFPGVWWDTERNGLYVMNDDYVVEFSIPSTAQPESLHLTLRMGASWNDVRRDRFYAQMSRLCNDTHSQAFAVSDNSVLLPVTVPT